MENSSSNQQQRERRKRKEELVKRKEKLVKLEEERVGRERERVKREEEERIKRKEERVKREEEERIKRRVKELEEKWKLPKSKLDQPQVRVLSALSLEQHDDVIVFKLANDEKKICANWPIVNIMDLMTSYIEQNIRDEVKEIAKNTGNYAGVKKMITTAVNQNLKSGWSHELLRSMETLELQELKNIIQPNQTDLDDFNDRNGIPRNSLLHRISSELTRFCGILLTPMGKSESTEESGNVPQVHPQIAVLEDHFDRNTAVTSDKYRPLEEGRQAYKEAEQISFNDVTESKVQSPKFSNEYERLLQNNHAMFLMMIGPAGSGKTTLTKRIVKKCLEEKKMAFFISFHRIGKNDRWSLKNLLLKFPLLEHQEYHPTDDQVQYDFQWILRNQEKCFIVLDGLDQSEFQISNDPIEADINDELFPSQLISLLLSRRFLGGVRLILTSRPHSIVQFAPVIQPNVVVFLNDLTKEDTETLMRHYIPCGDVEKILKLLAMKSPRIHTLVHTPLFLRIFAMLYNIKGEKIGKIVQTTASLFYEIIGWHQNSAHLGSEVDAKELNMKLGDIAYNKTMKQSVVFYNDDLQQVGLTANDVQDLVFAILENFTKHKNSSLVGLTLFYFMHQSIQEFLSVTFAFECLDLANFKEFLGKIFPQLSIDKKGELQVGEDNFNILRMFLIGCISEMKDRTIETDEILVKKNLFIQSLCGHLRQLVVENASLRFITALWHQWQLMSDLLDLQDRNIIDEIRNNLESHHFWIGFDSDKVGKREGFFHFLQQFTTNIDYLRVNLTWWSDDDVKRFFRSLQRQSTIEKLEIFVYGSSSIPSIDDVISILPRLTNVVGDRSCWSKLVLVFGVNVDQREFCEKMKEGIKMFDTTKLQTQKLDVKVKEYGTLLHVVLRRGETARIIESKF